ncbi:MAG: CPBP family intramembrane metalloprotease [Deltaproteobacteria bacterium]|nr:CPBP family intramembrane metalloprotease [Deltaproteobacteria bacterium]
MVTYACALTHWTRLVPGHRLGASPSERRWPRAIPFAKRRHLLGGLVATLSFALGYLWLIEAAGVVRLLQCFGGPSEWTVEAVTLAVVLLLLIVAIPAWWVLVFDDTHSGVTIWPKDWKRLGDGFTLSLAGAVFLWQLAVNLNLGAAERMLKAERRYGLMFDGEGLDWGWWLTRASANVLVEELLFSVLLQRAFEGYMPERNAAFVRAGVFWIVHMHLYGYGVVAIQGLAGLLYAGVFMRTRSLMAPALVHLLVNSSSTVLTVRGLGG